MVDRVTLTRPDGENEHLAEMLAASGIQTDIRPLIQLTGFEESESSKQIAMNIDQQDLIIFISKSAVRCAMPLLDKYWPQWPTSLAWYGVGKGTAETLSGYGIKAVYPEKPGSETLLALPEMSEVDDLKVLIVRGVGGRELLKEELAGRGAEVRYWEVYRRDRRQDAGWIEPGDNNTIVVTSMEGLESLKEQLGDKIKSQNIVVASNRIAEAASGFRRLSIASGASDQALYDAIVESM